MKCRNIFASLVFLSLFIFACATNQAITQSVAETASVTERIVELYIEGCDWPTTAGRIRLILEAIDGVLEVIKVDQETHTATVRFDPEKTNVEEMKALIEEWDQPGEKFIVKSFKYIK